MISDFTLSLLNSFLKKSTEERLNAPFLEKVAFNEVYQATNENDASKVPILSVNNTLNDMIKDLENIVEGKVLQEHFYKTIKMLEERELDYKTFRLDESNELDSILIDIFETSIDENIEFLDGKDVWLNAKHRISHMSSTPKHGLDNSTKILLEKFFNRQTQEERLDAPLIEKMAFSVYHRCCDRGFGKGDLFSDAGNLTYNMFDECYGFHMLNPSQSSRLKEIQGAIFRGDREYRNFKLSESKHELDAGLKDIIENPIDSIIGEITINIAHRQR